MSVMSWTGKEGHAQINLGMCRREKTLGCPPHFMRLDLQPDIKKIQRY